MTTEPDPTTGVDLDADSAAATATQRARQHRLRRVLSVLVGLVAVVGLIASVVAVWARGVVFNSETVAKAADKALQQPETIDWMATYLTDQMMVAIGVDEYVVSVLPDNLDRLSPALVGGIRTVVQNRITGLLSRDEVRGTVVQIVQRSHERLMTLLRGDGGVSGVSIKDGEVSLNLLPLLSRGLLAIQDLGVLESANVPVFTADGDPAAQQAELSAAIGRDLPPTFGQLVVYRSDELSNAQDSLSAAQDALVLARRALWLLLAITVLAFVACIALAVRRGRTAMILLLASAAAMVVVRAIVRRVKAEAPSLVVQPGARAAVRSTVTTLASGLLTAVTVIAILGVLAAIGLYLTGDSKRAVALRGRAGSAGGGLRGMVSAHTDVVTIVAFAAAVAVVYFAGLTIVTMIVALLLCALGVWAMRSSPEAAVTP